MARRRVQFAAAVTALAVGASALVSSPALGDGTTTTPIKCTGIPLLGSIDADMAINATDDVDPVMIGGSVKLLLKVPIPIGEIPVDITLSEGKITTPIPAGVSVTNVSFTSSSFPNKTWAVSGSNLVLTLSGNVTLGQGKPAPVMPDVTVTAKVSGVPRVISWKVPSSFGIKGSVSGLGSLNANCTPNNANTVMATTTVKAAAQAPVAHDQTIPVPFGQPANIVLSGTDVNNDPLTYDVATQPAHGTLSGTAPNLTYTPNPGYFGPDAFDFTVSDPTSGDNGTITLDVSPNPITIPSAPVITGVDLLGAGAGRIRWSAPSSNGGSALSGYRVSVVQNGVTTEVGTFSTSLSSATSLQLTDGVPAVFKVVALNAAGEGIVATAPAITPVVAAVELRPERSERGLYLDDGQGPNRNTAPALAAGPEHGTHHSARSDREPALRLRRDQQRRPDHQALLRISDPGPRCRRAQLLAGSAPFGLDPVSDLQQLRGLERVRAALREHVESSVRSEHLCLRHGKSR